MSTSLVFSGGGVFPAMYGIHGEAAVAKDDRVEVSRKRNNFSSTLTLDQEESSASSSIGVASSSSSGEDGEEEEVQSKKKEGAFGSLETLDDTLPMKRGLSNYFAGKSKSFAALSDLSNANAGDLRKPENPFNKRRRILIASKARRTSSYGSLSAASSTFSTSSSSLSLFSPDHTVDEEEEEAAAPPPPVGQKPILIGTITASPLITGGHDGGDERLKMMGLMKPAFRSPRSFSLSDLQQA